VELSGVVVHRRRGERPGMLYAKLGTRLSGAEMDGIVHRLYSVHAEKVGGGNFL